MGKVALLFSGQGSQVPGMGLDLARAFAVARHTFAEANDALGFDLARLCFEGPSEALARPSTARPAVCATSIAAQRVLQEEVGCSAQFLAGHSLGEYAALIVAEAIPFAPGLRAVRRVGHAMETIPGVMAAILSLRRCKVEQLLRDTPDPGAVWVSNYNGPTQIVVSGQSDAVARFGDIARQAGADAVVPLRVVAPCHSPLMAPAAEELRRSLHELTLSRPRVAVVSNVDVQIYADQRDILPLLLRHLVEPVEWEGTMRSLVARGVDTFIELGPGRVLCGLGRAIDRSSRFLNVSSPTSLALTTKSLTKYRAVA